MVLKYLARAIALGCVITSGAALAQQIDPAPRPNFLAAMGLLEQTTLSITTEAMDQPVKRPFSIELPSSGQIEARTKAGADGSILAVEFVTPDGSFVESIIFTDAQVEVGDPQNRLFAMANLLVLKAFPAIGKAYSDARILGFGATKVAGLPAVQLLGTHSASPLGPVLFRIVGFLSPDSADTVVALASLSAIRMPARGDQQLLDSFSGMTLESLKFLP